MAVKAENWQWSSYRNTVGLEESPGWLQVNWLLSCFGKRRSSTVEKYKVFVAEGKDQISPWSLLKKQIFLGDENFVEEMEAKIDKDRDLTEVPSSQRRAKARALTEYETRYESLNKSILAAYKSGGYTMKAIADHFNSHYSSVSKIIKFSSNS
ncbi:MAG: putative transposase [Candidatus Azotimanducaceae bacterium]|jgi:hypothetical protein